MGQTFVVILFYQRGDTVYRTAEPSILQLNRREFDYGGPRRPGKDTFFV